MGDVTSLGSVGRNDLDEVGGKAANLGELIRIGLPVPDGFVITTGAYRQLAETVPVYTGAGEEVRAAWSRVELPAGLRQSILDRYRSLGCGPVAVRSSATAEDLPGAAFAGQQDTYLDISGEDALIDAVRRCWASLWTDRAISYRARLGIQPSQVAIAVVVQQMVPATAAGVMFTADPVSGERDKIIIESAAGLGEAVVSGTVTPDHYRLSRDGSMLDHRQGPSGGGLHSAELSRLVELGLRVHDHYGRPMDIEWAVVRPSSGSARVQLVQARPITALPPGPIELTKLQRRANQAVLDYLPVRPYPLDMTTWTAHGPAEMLTRMANSIGVDLDLLSGLHETDGVVDAFRPVIPRPTLKIISAVPSVARRMRRFAVADWRQDPRYRSYREQLDRLADSELTEMEWDQLLGHLRLTIECAQLATDLRVDYLPSAGRAIARLMISCLVLGRRKLFADLLTGAPTVTREANDRLAELARSVAENPAVATDPADPDFSARLDEFLSVYGSRETVSPLLVSSPTWGDAPDHVRELIIMLARTGTGASTDDPGAVSGRATEQLLSHPWLRTPAARDRMRRRIAAARAGVGFREDSHFEMLRPLPLLRHTLIEIGRRLAAAGVVIGDDDVWHLRWQEIEELDPPDRLPGRDIARIRRIVEQRKAIRDALGSTPLIKIKKPVVTGDALLIGTPASSGQASGGVRVVRGLEDFGTLQAGEVLVCPYTNPSWTPLFQRAAAVVADTGGPGSHAAIVAREYGIPAVMGTRDGTSRLTDGQQITVDGDHGRVF